MSSGAMMTTMADAVTEMVTTVITSGISGSSSDEMKMTTMMTSSDEGLKEQVMLESKTIADHLHFVMSAIVGPIFCFLGLVGNVLTIITWCRPSMRGSTGRYLVAQAVADAGVLLFFLLVDSLLHWAPSVGYSMSYGVFFSYIGYPMFFFFIVVSIWFTVGVTIDRYIMVCWITRSKRLCSEKRANFGIFLIALNAFLINIPHFASYAPVSDSGNSTGTKTFAPTEFETGSGGKFYEFWIHCIILILIPWVTVLTLNIQIIRQIKGSNKRMEGKKTSQSMKKSRDSENQVTRLLLTVTFAFLFFIGVQCVVQCLWMQQPSGANMLLVSSSFAFAKVGIVFNSSLNFVFYCLTGRRFRLELMRVLRISKSDGSFSSIMEHSSSGTGSTPFTTSTSGF